MKQNNKLDRNNDGFISKEEIELEKELIDIQNKDEKQDAQRKMAWFSLFGMLLYPIFVIFSSLSGLESASKILGDMAATYFVSVAGIIMAFFGFQTWQNKK